MTSWELLHIFNLTSTKVRVRFNPVKIASYSTSLLEAGKPSWIAYSRSFPIGDCKIRPTLELEALDVPSTWSAHHPSSGEYARWGGFWGNSAIESAMTCPFNANLGWYLILYSLNSMTHLNILLDRSDLCQILLTSWFVSIVTWWAWKEGRSFWVTLFRAKVISSILEYQVSTSTIALLT